MKTDKKPQVKSVGLPPAPKDVRYYLARTRGAQGIATEIIAAKDSDDFATRFGAAFEPLSSYADKDKAKTALASMKQHERRTRR